jgi:two-component system sensor histidine kinase KdpD
VIIRGTRPGGNPQLLLGNLRGGGERLRPPVACRESAVNDTIHGVNQFLVRVVLRLSVCTAAIFALVFAYTRLIHANPTTVALSFLLLVLVISTFWGLLYSLFVAFVAAAAFNFFFLPPLGTFTIADSENWVALFVFLVTALIASQLSDRARKQKEQAIRGRRELERLYRFSQQLLTADNILQLLNAVPDYVINSFEVSATAVFIPERGALYRSGPETRDLDIEHLKSVIARGEPIIDTERNLTFIPLKMGVKTVGTLGVCGRVSRQTLEAIGGLIAIAVERASAVETLGRSEAAREGENLRSAILDSITHEFRTPLTAIKAAVTTLTSDISLSPPDRQELLAVIDEESDRLNHLVGEAAEVAKLESHEFQLQLENRRIPSVLEDAIGGLRPVLAKHPIEVRCAEDFSFTIDADRIKEVLAQLIENAAKYSAPDAPICITAEDKAGDLFVSVSDQGVGIDDMEQALIFDKFYRGKNQRYRVQGTGMGLAIARAIVEAHGGKIGVTSQIGSGSVFYFSVPARK